MSFSSEQKASLAALPIKSACCRRAYIQGILAARARLIDGEIVISVDGSLTDEVCRAVEEVYSKRPSVSSAKNGGRRKLVSFTASSASRFMESFFTADGGFDSKCKLCQAHFLRGVFLACGRISDPEKQYLLEFSFGDGASKFIEFFTELGLSARLSVKPNEKVVYFKRSEAIEDFFALAGMNQTAFAFMDAKIQGELRNNANRVANCETNNIGRAVTSSMHQIELISELFRRGLSSQLPDELEKTARLRMEHSDLSLSQLAARITPHISKPGLSHRLKKITELAEEILKGNLGNT